MSCENIPIAYGETWEKPIQLKNLSDNSFFDFTGYTVTMEVTTDAYKAVSTVTGMVANDGLSISFELTPTFWTAIGDKPTVAKRDGIYKAEIKYTASGNTNVIPNLTLKINI